MPQKDWRLEESLRWRWIRGGQDRQGWASEVFFPSWSIIALQCCVSFCYTTWMSYMYTYIPPSWASLPPPPSPPPLKVITEHQAELPVLFSSFPPAICFTHTDVFMSLLFSQSILHFFLHCVRVSFNYSCVSIPALQIGSSVPFF